MTKRILTEEQKLKQREASRRYRQNSPNYAKTRDAAGKRYRQRNKARWKTEWIFTLRNIRQRCREKDIPYDITPQYVQSITPTHCPLLGVELTREFKNNPSTQACIDRIVPELGYVKGNVMVISRRANSIKNDASADELIAIGTKLKAILEEKGNLCRGMDHQTTKRSAR